MVLPINPFGAYGKALGAVSEELGGLVRVSMIFSTLMSGPGQPWTKSNGIASTRGDR